MNKTVIIAAGLILSVLAVVTTSAEIFPVKHFQLTDGEETAGQFLVVDKIRESVNTTGLTAGLLELEDGSRILLTQRLDLNEGLSIEQIQDLSGGWWAELVFDYGFRNISDPADFADPMQAAIEVGERARREQAPETYILTLSNGVSIEWVIPWGEAQEERREKEHTALAKLAAALAEDPPPSSLLSGLEILAALKERPDSFEVVGADVIPLLWDALQAAQEPSPSARVVQVVKGESGDRARLLKVAKRSIEGE